MIAYVDSSALLRSLLNHPSIHPDWGSWEDAVTSALTEVETLRTLDRYRLSQRLTDPELAQTLSHFRWLWDTFHVLDLDEAVLRRAGQPFPTSLGTLDALHLASALLWKERSPGPMHFLTHDAQLGTAAQAVGFRI